MNASKDRVALTLAKSHAEAEDAVSKVIRVRSAREEDDNEPIKLLEVNLDTPSAGVVPVTFGRSTDVPYASVVVEVTPEEFRRIENGELELPSEWELAEILFEKTVQGL